MSERHTRHISPRTVSKSCCRAITTTRKRIPTRSFLGANKNIILVTHKKKTRRPYKACKPYIIVKITISCSFPSPVVPLFATSRRIIAAVLQALPPRRLLLRLPRSASLSSLLRRQVWPWRAWRQRQWNQRQRTTFSEAKRMLRRREMLFRLERT